MKLAIFEKGKRIYKKLENMDISSYNYKHCECGKEQGVFGLLGVLAFKYFYRIFLPLYLIILVQFLVIPFFLGYYSPPFLVFVLYSLFSIGVIIFVILFSIAYCKYYPSGRIADMLREKYKNEPNHPINRIPNYVEYMAHSREW